jgi:hypothetical protein
LFLKEMVVAKDKIILSVHIGALCFATLKDIRRRKPEAAAYVDRPDRNS